MKFLLFILLGLPIVLLSFSEPENVGKLLFEANCQSCHFPNKKIYYEDNGLLVKDEYFLDEILNSTKIYSYK